MILVTIFKSKTIAPNQYLDRVIKMLFYYNSFKNIINHALLSHYRDFQIFVFLHNLEVPTQISRLIKSSLTLAGMAPWIECWPMNQRVAGLIPSQGTCLGCWPGPSRGCMRGTHTLMFLSLSFHL